MPKMAVNTNRMTFFTMILMMLVLLLAEVDSVEAEVSEVEFSGVSQEGEDHLERGIHPSHSVLYPSLVLTIGVAVYYTLSRFLHWLPYTAIMFLMGTIMGLLASSEILLVPGKHYYYVNDALNAWQDIDSEVLLLVFLPGLIFKDALGQNPFLFAMAFGQLFIFAFPNVLAGTYLTALVGYYILPYEWPFFLCLTFGAIMSATDPVAVSALLEEVGKSRQVSFE